MVLIWYYNREGDWLITGKIILDQTSQYWINQFINGILKYIFNLEYE